MNKVSSGVLLILGCVALSLSLAVYDSEAHGSNELKFIRNEGQWNGRFHYKARTQYGDLFIENQGFSLQLVNPDYFGHNHDKDHHEPEVKARGQAIKFRFLQATGGQSTKSGLESKEYYNYFLGNKRHATGIKAYGQVRVQEIYPGIDAEYLEQDGHLKYQFLLQDPADLGKITIRIEGANQVNLRNNKLQIKTLFGDIEETGLVAYQHVNGERKLIGCQYRLQGNEVSYRLSENPIPGVPLVIDPILVFSTFSGSTGDNWGFTATYGEEGTGYVGGIVFSSGFPVTAGVWDDTYNGIDTGSDLEGFDIGILKFSGDGRSLLYATYLGGNEAETVHSLVVDRNNNLVVFGATGSGNFPTSSNAVQRAFRGGTPYQPFSAGSLNFRVGSDLFIAKFSPDGRTLTASTFYGGTSNDGVMNQPAIGNSLVANYGDQFRGDVIVDVQNRVYIVSTTSSTNYPLRGPIQNTLRGGLDGVVSCLSADLSSTVWSTYLGGNNLDAIYGIQIDNANRVVVTGGTTSTNFFTSATALNRNAFGQQDAFVSIISPTGNAILHSTYLGTPANDQGFLVQADSLNNVYVFGQSQGDMPVSAGVFSVANGRQFIYKLNSTLSRTEFSTVFGGQNGNINISPTAFLVDRCNQIYISGWGGAVNGGYVGGNTLNMPLTTDAFQSNTDGSDFYLMVLEANARTLKYATYFGGTGLAEHVDGGTSRFDPSGIVYHAVCAGCGGRSDFPTTPGVWSQTNRSPNCNSAIYKFDFSFLRAEFQTTADSGCAPLRVNFNNESRNGTRYVWEFQDGTVLDTLATSVNHIFREPGLYNVTLRATNNSTCPNQSIARRTIKVFETPAIRDSTLRFCTLADTLNINLNGKLVAGSTYQWSPTNFLSNPDILSPQILNADTALSYSLITTSPRGCRDTTNLRLNNGVLSLDLSSPDSAGTGCTPYKVALYQQNFQATQLAWIYGSDTLITGPNRDSLLLDLVVPGTYVIRLLATSDVTCQSEVQDSVVFTSVALPVLSDTTFYFCGPNDTLTAMVRSRFSEGARYAWEPNLFLTNDSVASPRIIRPDSSLVYTVRATLPIGCQGESKVRLINREFSLKLFADTSRGCVPFPVEFQGIANPQPQSLYYLVAGDTITRIVPPFNYSAVFPQPIDYQVVLVARNDTTCQVEMRDTLQISVGTIAQPQVFNNNYCPSDTLALSAHTTSSDYFYKWTPTPTYSSDSLATARYLAGLHDTIAVSISNDYGCTTSTRFFLNPIRLFPDFAVIQAYDSCVDLRSASFVNQTPQGPNISWDFGNGSTSTINTPSTQYPSNGTYTVRLRAENGNCLETIEKEVVFNNEPVAFEPAFDFEKIATGCNESPLVKMKNASVNIDSSYWDFGDGRLSKELNPEHIYVNEGTFNVSLTVKRGACYKTTAKDIESKKLLVPNVVTSFADGKNDTYKLMDIGSNWKVSVYNRYGRQVFETDNYKNNWPDQEVKAGTYFIKVESPFNKGCNHWLEVLGE